MVYSGAWGNLIHEKNQKQKISWHCPFNLMPCRYEILEQKYWPILFVNFSKSDMNIGLGISLCTISIYTIKIWTVHTRFLKSFDTRGLRVSARSQLSVRWVVTYFCINHKVRTYKEYHSVCPSSELGLSQPLSRQRVFTSPQRQGGGSTLACGRGVGGSPNSDEGLHCGTLYMYVLCGINHVWQVSQLARKVTKLIFKSGSLQDALLIYLLPVWKATLLNNSFPARGQTERLFSRAENMKNFRNNKIKDDL